MTTDNSDYSKPRTKIQNYLPEVFQSDIQISVDENLFNRFLTKNETVQVSGYIGEGSAQTTPGKQLQEQTIDRQANQLQPILNTKIGSEQFISSWKDIQDRAQQLGIDLSQLPTWGAVQQFNWVPGINIDKLVNYQNYYWYDVENPTSQPDYITIFNSCTQATAYANFWQNLTATYGTSFTIVNILSTLASQYNQFVVSGNYSALFVAGLVFNISNSTNTSINNTTQKVISSVFNNATNETTITVTNSFSDNTVSGVVSLAEQLTTALTNRDCVCSNVLGWDQQQWDDNPNNPPTPIWGDPPNSQPALITAISHSTAPSGTPSDNSVYNVLWYDTISDQLYQWSGSAWSVIVNNFSNIISQTTGTNNWDDDSPCANTFSTTPSAQQWITSNKWVHKNDVTNFTIAKRAQYPIIEFLPNLELNEWIYTTFNWQYRVNSNVSWTPSTSEPSLIELTSLSIQSLASNSIILDERHGNQTSYFVPGKQFAASNDVYAINTNGTNNGTVYLIRPITVTRSYFVKYNGNQAYQTVIEYTCSDPNITHLSTSFNIIPVITSTGDLWRGYNVHWLFGGAKNTVPVNHQTKNLLSGVVSTNYTTDGNYQYQNGPYTQVYTLMDNVATPHYDLSTATVPGSSRTLCQRALLGNNDIRVYVNGIRQYGTYTEYSSDAIHVTGIEFAAAYTPATAGTVITIDVGESSNLDLGLTAVPVLTSSGTQTVSLVSYRLNEQVKNTINQYPLFDMYNPDGTSANKASSIFGYQIDQTQPVIPPLSQRIVQSSGPINFGFEQFLIDFDNGNLYCYRDYSNQTDNYWADGNTIKVWTGLNWDVNFTVSDLNGNSYYTTGYVGAQQPLYNDFITGDTDYLWFDTTSQTLKVRISSNNTLNDFQLTSGVSYQTFDITLQTVWRDGINDEQAIPTQVDWANRTLDQYTSEQNIYVAAKVNQGVSGAQALADWYNSQINPFSPTGQWVGDWGIPDPLYFNNLHENRKLVSYLDLVTHFSTIINAQPTIPAFSGPQSNMFHLLSPPQINYGLGGTIKEYNNGFDTFLSALYNKTVDPISLIQFAHDQYEILLNNVQAVFEQTITTYLTTISLASLTNIADFISNNIITNIADNEYFSLLFGDSGTYDSATQQGLKNWIDTLVYINVIRRCYPVRLVDTTNNIDVVTHHDTHLKSYALLGAEISGVINKVISTPDNRNGTDTFGRVSTNLPPNTISSFATSFSTSIVNRPGVYWYYTPSNGTNVFYRLNLLSAGPIQPTGTIATGSLWADTGTNTLWTYNGTKWIAVTSVGDGLIDSAWVQIDINTLLNSTILAVENVLYNFSSQPATLPYDLSTLPNINKISYDSYLEQTFLDYVARQGITNAFENLNYSITNPFTWNYTYSTIGSGYNIIASDSTLQAFIISDPKGTFVNAFQPGEQIYVKNSQSTNDGTWTVSSNGATWNSNTQQTTIFVVNSSTHSVFGGVYGILYQGDVLPSSNNTGAESAGYWAALYQAFYNTPYPHLEPWKLQGYYEQPTWWNAQYNSTSRRWNATMWSNIANGVIPAGLSYPNGVISITGNPATDVSVYFLDVPLLPTYSYFSVNIGDTPILAYDGRTYEPDALLPPYWAGPYSSNIRSLFTSINDIVSPGSNFVFGIPGPIEWQWRVSSQFLYDQLKVAFRLDPVRFISNTFGKQFDIIDDLQIDKDTNNTFSHTRTDFQGDIVNNTQYVINGLNQWYVNFNRYLDVDGNYNDFRALWTQWIAPMTYQMSSFIDTKSLIVGQRNVSVSNFDWNVTSKHNSGSYDYWLDAFVISTNQVAPIVSWYNNEKSWQFTINTNLSISRTINYYAVQNYQFCNLFSTQINGAQVASNTFSIYTYPITATDVTNSIFSISGDQTDVIKSGVTFTVFDSSTNDGNYTVLNVAYDQLHDQTLITVSNTLNTVFGIQVFGKLKLNYRSLPWQTGQMVYLTSDQSVPGGLTDETYYFVIMVSPTEFQLANTQVDAFANKAITITSVGKNNQYIGNLQNVFTALNGANTSIEWKHYVSDPSTLLTFSTPYNISGIQNVINIIDGYDTYTNSLGWIINATGELKDPVNPTRIVSWQLETERFIDYLYGSRSVRNAPPDSSFPISVNTSTSEFTFLQSNGQFATGDALSIISQNYNFPAPLIENVVYYIIVDSATTFRLASSRIGATNGVAITLTPSAFSGQLSVVPPVTYTQDLPPFEINPFRNGIWFNTSQGIVSNIFKGNADGIQTTPLIYDQYGRQLSDSIVNVYRQDKQTHVAVFNNVANDVQRNVNVVNPYAFLHLGGLHLFVDTYENVLVFNDYTTEGQLLYDPFVGLNVPNFEVQFLRQPVLTERPNVGGYFLQNYFNQNASLAKNFEASIEDLRYMYSTYTSNETDAITAASRTNFGYQGLTQYLNQLNMDPKSQFVFWRGMIHAKGSDTAIKALLNSIRFKDATVDEFWAIKLSDFGSINEKFYPGVYITMQDARAAQVLFDFIQESDLCYPGFAVNAYDEQPCGYSYPVDGGPIAVGDNGFTPILLTDQTRWYDQPDVLAQLNKDGGSMYFTTKVIGKIQVAFVTSATGIVVNQDYIANVSNYVNSSSAFDLYKTTGRGVVLVDTTNNLFTAWVYAVNTFVFSGYWDSTTTTNQQTPVFRHSFKADAINITLSLYDGKVITVTNVVGNTLSLSANDYYIPFTNGIKLFKNSIPLVSGTDYSETLDTSGNLLSSQIYFPTPLVASDKITILYQPSTLVQELHYNVINSDVISFLFKELVDGTTVTSSMDLTIWGFMEDDTSQNPARLIDTVARVDVTPIQLWDPARGINYSQAQYNIDLSTNIDPAVYNNSPVTSDITTVEDQYWGSNEVATTWLDTSTVKYYTYYDFTAISDQSTRFANWGALADWATVTVYEWVKSSVPPDQWNTIAQAQENDINIPETVRVAGRVYQRLFKKVNNQWQRYTTEVQEMDVSVDGIPVPLTGQITSYDFKIDTSLLTISPTSPFTPVDVYKNGKRLALQQVPFMVNGDFYVNLTANQVTSGDHITFVIEPPTDSAIIAAGVSNGTLQQAYEYTSVPYYDNQGNLQYNYYFWVQNKITRGTNNRTLSPANTQQYFVNIPVPFMFFQNVKDPVTVDVNGFPVNMPLRYSQCIISGLRGLIDDDNRYIIRYTRDFTLRDNLSYGATPLTLKDKHQQWQLIRPNQASKIARNLWDNITESIVGYNLTNPSLLVPSLARQLYDATYGTQTQYGFEIDQAFAQGTLALQCVQNYLEDQNNNFQPIDINLFLQQYTFDTPSNIITSMNEIYETFSTQNVNAIFFSVLQNAALPQKYQYAGILKTSMLAVTGVLPL